MNHHVPHLKRNEIIPRIQFIKFLLYYLLLGHILYKALRQMHMIYIVQNMGQLQKYIPYSFVFLKIYPTFLEIIHHPWDLT